MRAPTCAPTARRGATRLLQVGEKPSVRAREEVGKEAQLDGDAVQLRRVGFGSADVTHATGARGATHVTHVTHVKHVTHETHAAYVAHVT